MKNVYVVSDVLHDYTPGMIVIIASDLAEVRSLFFEEFYEAEMKEFDAAIANNKYKVIPTYPDQESRVVSYVYGGG